MSRQNWLILVVLVVKSDESGSESITERLLLLHSEQEASHVDETSTHPRNPPETVRVVHAAFPKGNLSIHLRDTLGTVYQGELFDDLYPGRGQPAYAPWRLALVTVFQFMENLTDSQTADAVHRRMDLDIPQRTAFLGVSQFSSGSSIRLFLVFGEPLKTADLSGMLLQKWCRRSMECRRRPFSPSLKG